MRSATFALFAGVVYLSLGVVGLIPEALGPAPAGAPPTRLTTLYGTLLGLFPVNVLHSALHLGFGAAGVFAYRRLASARAFARVLAVAFGVLAVLGLVPGASTLFGIMPLHGHSIWLHGITAALGAYFGWRTVTDVERRDPQNPDRRQTAAAVEKERRRGHGDRRLPASEV